MSAGLLALLDDVAVIAKAAAASIDDVGVAASKAGTKVAGVVIDDAAVTPSYVTGLTPDRELPIIGRITLGSLKNKLLILLPGALLLSWLIPQAITPILMLGGAYLSYEGAEKAIEKLGGAKHGATLEDPITDMEKFERERTQGAIRTDLILSGEIMAITLATVATESFLTRALVLALVGVVITIVVYGAVALIVKMDDIGLALTKRSSATARKVGCGLLRAMPKLLGAISFIGTVAMLWVGGGILLHGSEELGLGGPAHWAHGVQQAVASMAGTLGGVLGWASYAALSAVAGLLIGSFIVFVVHTILRINGTEK